MAAAEHTAGITHNESAQAVVERRGPRVKAACIFTTSLWLRFADVRRLTRRCQVKRFGFVKVLTALTTSQHVRYCGLDDGMG